MKIVFKFTLALGAGLFFAATASPGAVIDFETAPAGGTPPDDSFITAPYGITGGGTVAFFFDINLNNAFDPGTDTLPVFEAAGDDANDGFSNDTLGTSDTANGGLASQLGNFFLRQLQPGSPPPPFIVDYNTSQVVSGLTGEIWDIDGAPGITEHWLVEVLSASNVVLASQSSPLGSSSAYDGLPWVFSFIGLPAGVDKVRITFDGSKTTGLGLAFNNFNPLAIPEPSTGCLAIVAIAITSLARRSCSY